METAPYLAGYRAVDRRSWNKTLFYVDLLVIAIFGLSLVFLVVHSYAAGWAFAQEEYVRNNEMLWKMVTDAAFLVGSVAWIFARFFRNQYLATRAGRY